MLTKHKNLIFLALFFLATLILYHYFLQTKAYQNLLVYGKENTAIYFIFLTLFKVLGIIWPPIPGSIITIGSIPIIGWKLAALSDVIGGLIGASIAYFLGKKFGFSLLNKFFDSNQISKIKSISIKQGKELQAVIVLRILYGSISELISYGAGIIKISYKNFLLGSISAYPINVFIFYLSAIFASFDSTFVYVPIIILSILAFKKVKSKYFEIS